ncbi:TraC family protein [Rhizobium sp. AQ_MP]|uniref:TraC family protein n=1 Tax=Rhizobium sp. AQ_MP TaxID=2761536 RepID=UPI001639610E|nr:TraC family protein [Rhizobium sp. AQ_MP]MBC2775810.1 TraC family protein [Rhizobium sp. AQ_MP]
MKKTSARIREDLARLHEQLKRAETRDAERIGRIALKAGLGEIDITEGDLHLAFEEMVNRFQQVRGAAGERGRRVDSRPAAPPIVAETALSPAGQTGEA